MNAPPVPSAVDSHTVSIQSKMVEVAKRHSADHPNIEYRVADFMELAELMCGDALERRESCGGHFREEYQTADGEALRDDENFSHVAAWEHCGVDEAPKLHREPLEFEHVTPSQRSYK